MTLVISKKAKRLVTFMIKQWREACPAASLCKVSVSGGMEQEAVLGWASSWHTHALGAGMGGATRRSAAGWSEAARDSHPCRAGSSVKQAKKFSGP